MKRELFMVLLGASILIPAEADAQRNRTRDRSREDRSGQPAPVQANGRIAYPAPRGGRRAWDRGTRVVYSSRAGRAPYRGRQLWVRADWGRIRMRAMSHRRDRRTLNQSDLRHVLGRHTVNRVKNNGRRTGLRGSLRGHWVNQRGQGRILIVTMGRVDVAEFIDFDRDGFVDDVFMIRNGRGRRVSRW